MKIVLASQSPRRKELLGKMGLEFTTKAPEIDETALSGLPARQLVEALSREKALWVARQEDPEAIVIGSDTVVVRDGEILGKPASPAQAEEMLSSLSGRSHEVCTGITVCQGNRVVSQVEVTRVTFRTLTPQEIARYVRTGEPMDKAGAYGIQGLGALLVEGIQGDYSAVVGLPVCRLGRILLDFGVDCLALSAGREEDAL
ncbi:MAG: Maf family protein [Evtepia sp.]